MAEEIYARTILNSFKEPDPWFGIKYNMNLYRGCRHQCIYCDSRSECYRIEDFSRVQVKTNAIDLLRRELPRKKIKGTIGTGSMHDPYMPDEAKYGMTRKALEIIAANKFPVHIITKSDLILRDADLLKEIGKVYAAASITITTANDGLGLKLEPGAPKVSQRFTAIEKLAKEGVLTGITAMPILPFIEDNDDNLKAIVERAKDSGANYILFGLGVSLRDRQRDYFYNKLDAYFPGIKQKYEKVYGLKYWCNSPEYDRLKKTVQNLCVKYGMPTKMPFYIPEEPQADQLELL
jgi:DNA repair photolyase